MPVGGVEQRIAVGRCRPHRLRGDDALRARPRFDDHRLSELLAERLREDACAQLRGAARREGNDQADGLARILLRHGARPGKRGGNCGNEHFHGGHSGWTPAARRMLR